MGTQRKSAGSGKKPAAKKAAKKKVAARKTAAAQPVAPPTQAPPPPPGRLTPTQEAFCQEYLKDRKGGPAYRRLYPHVQPNSARTEAWRILSTPEVQAYLEEKRVEHIRSLSVDRERLLGELVAIATADPNDLVEYRREACPKCWRGRRNAPPNESCRTCGGQGVGFAFIKDTRFLPPKARSLYAGVKETRDGVQVLMRDQDGAVDRLARILGMFKFDNEQKSQPLAEAVAQLMGEIHSIGGARLPIATQRRSGDGR